MGGRRSAPLPEGGGQGRRRQGGDATGRNVRGHGAHHRPVGGAPRPFATGRGRSDGDVRQKPWRRGSDETVADLPAYQKLTGHQERLEDAGAESQKEGTDLPGLAARGTVVEVHKGACLVRLADCPAPPPGGAPLPPVLRVVPRGMLQHYDMGLSSLVAAGDFVDVRIAPVHGDQAYEGMLARVAPRRSEFRRFHPSGRSIQTLAANVDQVAAVASCAEPDFRPGFVDRVLVCAAASSIPGLVIVNKMDLGLSPADAALLTVYRGLGVPVLETSVRTGAGMDALREILNGRRTLLCGHSGVGKSSLLVALAPEFTAGVRIEEVSGKTTKGQHTTTHARLYAFAGGELVDTPGLRELTPADTNRQDLWNWFPELAARQGQCPYPDCTHRHEKDCAILAALEAGQIHPRRYESYVHILETLPQ